MRKSQFSDKIIPVIFRWGISFIGRTAMAEAKKDRNRELYEAKEAGVPFTKLAEKYGMTVTCANTIYRREKIKEEHKNERYYQLLVSLTDSDEMITRTVHVLERNELASAEAIMNVTKKELLKCRNCGDVMADLILKSIQR